MDTQPLWSERDLAQPHEVADKARRVQAMFAAIAHRYDLVNRVHSLGRDQGWRRAAARAAAVRARDVVVDVACGTGDLTLALARMGAGRAIGLDFAESMLEHAAAKTRRLRLVRTGYGAADALRLPLKDRSVDAVTMAFGIRNVVDPMIALREFARVLRPGGRLVILEFGLPRVRPLRMLYQFYFRRILPRTAGFIARDRTRAYRYLAESVNTFLTPTVLAQRVRNAGFVEVTVRPLTLGVALLYRGVKARRGSEGG